MSQCAPVAVPMHLNDGVHLRKTMLLDKTVNLQKNAIYITNIGCAQDRGSISHFPVSFLIKKKKFNVKIVPMHPNLPYARFHK